MSFYGSLGNVQIASDFRIVTTLQEQINNLFFPRSHLSKLIFHALHLAGSRFTGRKWHYGASGSKRKS